MRHLLGTSFSTSRPSHPSNELHCTQHHLLGKPPPQFFSAYVGASANSYRLPPHSSQPLASPSAMRTCPWGGEGGGVTVHRRTRTASCPTPASRSPAPRPREPAHGGREGVSSSGGQGLGGMKERGRGQSVGGWRRGWNFSGRPSTWKQMRGNQQYNERRLKTAWGTHTRPLSAPLPLPPPPAHTHLPVRLKY